MPSLYAEDFLSDHARARALYSHCATQLAAIAPFTCLSIEKLAQNRPYANVAELLLSDDDGVLRAMRACGTDELFVTGPASDFEKFRALCACMPQLLGLPIYERLHAVSERILGCSLPFNRQNCERIWMQTAKALETEPLTPRLLAEKMHVTALGIRVTPDAPLQLLEKIQKEWPTVRVFPVLCPWELTDFEKKGYPNGLKRLSAACGVVMTDLQGLHKALNASLDKFDRLPSASHRLNAFSEFCRPDPYHAELVFAKALGKEEITREERDLLAAQLLRICGREYVRRDVVLQLTLGAQVRIPALTALLDYLESCEALPRTVLYSETPSAVALLCGRYAAVRGMPRVLLGNCGSYDDTPSVVRARLSSLVHSAPFAALLGAPRAESLLSFAAQDTCCRALCALIEDLARKKGIQESDEELAALVLQILSANAARVFED